VHSSHTLQFQITCPLRMDRDPVVLEIGVKGFVKGKKGAKLYSRQVTPPDPVPGSGRGGRALAIFVMWRTGADWQGRSGVYFYYLDLIARFCNNNS
jgi:hypothetical protein